MKFTNGYWVIKPEMQPLFPAEVYETWREGDAFCAFLPGKPIIDRGDTLNTGGLTLRVSAPMENALRIELIHHAGAKCNGPFFEQAACPVSADIRETPDAATYICGALGLRLDKTPSAFALWFFDNDTGKAITHVPFHGLAHMQNQENGCSYMLASLALDAGEYVYGLGERFTAFTKNGQVVEMWNEDGGTSSEIAYKNIPFYMTNRGYGVFVNDPGRVSYEVASEKVGAVQFSVEGERLDFTVIYGPHPKAILQRYAAMTGRPALPPAWTFGLWLTTSFTTPYDEQVTSGFLDGMRQRDIPLRVFHYDCFWMRAFHWCDFLWDSDTFPDAKAMLQRCHEAGLKVCVWINPYIAQRSALFDEGMQRGYFIHTADGGVWQWDMWQAGMACVDFTNPDACAWYCAQLETLLDAGVDSFKTDFGERIPHENVTYYDGSDPVRMHNYYALLYNRTVFDLLERKLGRGEAAVFARSATAGAQAFPVHWGGDNSATYASMAETLRGGLSLSLCGFGFWSHDISGFEQTAPADIYKRWCAFGMLSSHSRLHGSASYRVPWLFDEEACDVLRHFVSWKCRLMPYLYRASIEARDAGTPVMRPMMLEFPDDPACATLDMQYLLGPSLLVAPVFREDGRADFYLPQGTWTHLFTGASLPGGHYRESYDYFSLPLFVRDNTLLSVGSVSDKPDYAYEEALMLRLYALEDGATARCEIPDIHGGIVAEATARRDGNRVTVSARGLNHWSLALYGMNAPLGINGGVMRGGMIEAVADTITVMLS